MGGARGERPAGQGKRRKESDLVELVEENPWAGECVEFKVPGENAEREWRRKIYCIGNVWKLLGDLMEPAHFDPHRE